MKKKIKTHGLIAIIAVITLSLAACGGDESTETFTVTFIANGGTPEPQAQKIEKGKTATEPTAMTKENNAFDGWYKENTFSTKWNFTTDTVTTEITLYAKWMCNCTDKEHLGIGETCDCGGAICNCTYKEYGKINGIPVYRTTAVTDAQMAGVFAKLEAGYNGVAAGAKAKITTTNVTAIHITNDAYGEYVGASKVIKIGHTLTSAQITSELYDIANDYLAILGRMTL
jgi:uncharacterized repeat protein (TIGR02543 family)